MSFFRVRGGNFFSRFSTRRSDCFFNKNSLARRSYASYYYFDQPRLGPRYFFWGPRSKNFFIATGVIATVIGITHINEAPVTHRRRLMLCPRWVEDGMAKMSYNSIMAQYDKYILPANSPTSIRVRKVMNRLIFAAEHYNDPDTGTPQNLFENMKGRNIPAEDWKIHVIDDIAMHQESPNAFVIGDGKVFVFRSILPLCKDDDGLATVLAHELGHQLADHIGEKLTKSPMYLSLVLLSYSLFGSNNLGNIAVSLGLERPSSRAMETEADYIGLMLMAHACFNPHEAPEFWSRMIEFEKKSGGSIPEFFSTHPSSERRNETLKELMPKAERSYELGGCGNFADRFRTFSLF